jgi:hypothetical protein
MTPFIDEAQRLLRLAERDYETFSILRAHPHAKLAPPASMPSRPWKRR